VLLLREVPVRERVLVLRGLDAPPVDRDDADLRAPVDLRAVPDLAAPEERVAPELADFARVDAFFAPPVERDFVAVPLLARFAVERELVDLRALLARVPLLRDDADPVLPLLREDEEPELAPDPSLVLHLPDITRCAASATASAIIDPSLVALDMTLLAAVDAVSAASRPASRIFLRAAGLALIAAAAAARPAASISLLIAALASLSAVVLLEPERDEDDFFPDFEELDREELLRADFAIFYLPPSGQRHFRAVPVP
jgi:hypothetical protein